MQKIDGRTREETEELMRDAIMEVSTTYPCDKRAMYKLEKLESDIIYYQESLCLYDE